MSKAWRMYKKKNAGLRMCMYMPSIYVPQIIQFTTGKNCYYYNITTENVLKFLFSPLSKYSLTTFQSARRKLKQTRLQDILTKDKEIIQNIQKKVMFYNAFTYTFLSLTNVGPPL